MFSRMKKELKSVNEMWLLALLLAASSAIFITAGCGTWNEGTGPTAGSTSTPTATITVTSSITPTVTETATETATATSTNTPIVAACPNPDAVVLGGAGNYVLLAETGITDTLAHACAVTGNVGNSPGGGAQIGINCPEVTGNIYEVDTGYTGTDRLCGVLGATLTTDITNMGTAYTNANLQSACVTNLDAGILSGETLTRGVYKFTTGVTIPTNLHLDALSDASARWVFQIAGTLTMASAVTIFLDNGAVPQNVVWTVAGANATIGTTAQFAGVLMAGPSCLIAINTGATVHGRLLSQTQITLQSNVVTFP